jgi:hypothetical protein
MATYISTRPADYILRTARKPHECVACRDAIPVGRRYVENMTAAEGAYASGTRYCPPCAVDAEMLAEETI